MVNLSDYRIKTKKEFLAEFGEGWREELGSYFVPKMDILFGMSLDEIEFHNNLENVREWVENGEPIDDVMIKSPIYGYYISRDMVTAKDAPSVKPLPAVKPKKAVKPKEWYDSGHHYDIEMSVSGRDTSVVIWFDNKSFEGKARTHEGEQNVPAVGFIVALSRAVEKAKKVLGRIPAIHNVFDDMD